MTLEQIRTELAAKKTIICAAVLLLAAILLDARALFQSKYAVGVDGYYYVLQIDSYLNQGSFYFPSQTPLVLYFLSSLAYLFNDTVFAIKIGVLILQLFLSLGILALVTSVTRNIWLGILGMSIAAFSNLHLFLLGEFLNSLGALTFLVWCGFGLSRFYRTKRKKWLIFSLSAMIIAVFCHRSTLGLIAILSISFAVSYLVMRSKTLKIKFLGFLLFLRS